MTDDQSIGIFKNQVKSQEVLDGLKKKKIISCDFNLMRGSRNIQSYTDIMYINAVASDVMLQGYILNNL